MLVIATTPGVFWSRPDPDAEPFCVPGDRVSVDTQVALIEVMKMFVPIEAGVAGTFGRYLREDGLPVDAGDTLAEISEGA